MPTRVLVAMALVIMTNAVEMTVYLPRGDGGESLGVVAYVARAGLYEGVIMSVDDGYVCQESVDNWEFARRDVFLVTGGLFAQGCKPSTLLRRLKENGFAGLVTIGRGAAGFWTNMAYAI